MKTYFNILVIIIFILSIGQVKANAKTFRVQCHDEGKLLPLEDFNRIPERQAYKLANGQIIYFSGGFFEGLDDAKKRLLQLSNQGIKGAFIRVFDHQKYVNKPVSDYLLRICEESIKRKIENRLDSSAAYLNNTQKTTTGTSIELWPVGFSKGEKIDHAPTFKIVVLKVKSNQSIKLDYTEITKTLDKYSFNGYTYVTIGNFTSLSDAQKQLKLLNQSIVNYQLEINGFYKGMLFSQDTAKEMLTQFYLSK